MLRMEKPIADVEPDGRKTEDSLHCLRKDIKPTDNRISERLVRKVQPEHPLILDSRIPKQIITFDEQYLRRCLEIIQISALKAASSNIPSYTAVFSDNFGLRKISSGNGNTCDLNGIVIECPSIAGTENVVISSAGDSIIGAITGSKSMINILKSPLLRQLGGPDTDGAHRKTSSIDIRGPIYSNYLSPPGGPYSSISQKLEKDAVALKNRRHGNEHIRKSLGSASSTNSSGSGQSSSSGPVGVSQGMLHCTWNNGLPHYVFSVDDQREIYVANLLKVEMQDNKGLDYMYTFHSRAGGRKEDEIDEKQLDLVGKMRVSTSFTLLSDNTEIMETQFTLFGFSDDCLIERENTSHTLKKNKGFSKKVVDVLKASHTFKQKNSGKLGFSCTILENSSWDPSQDLPDNLGPVSRAILLEDVLPPNLELATIIVRDSIHDTNCETNNGGWGLNFLKKVANRPTNASLETELSSQFQLHNNADCSTSMDILIPAGFHSGPRTRTGGPSSLAERWRSGGQCDCGGWDIGCPLTVLNTKPSRKEVLSLADFRWESMSCDLFVEGLKPDGPAMKMVNINDGLYYIPFQSTLSAMQSFSIAAAILHSHSPTLQPKLYKVKK